MRPSAALKQHHKRPVLDQIRHLRHCGACLLHGARQNGRPEQILARLGKRKAQRLCRRHYTMVGRRPGCPGLALQS